MAAEPTTVGELGIMLSSTKDLVSEQLRGISNQLEKLDGMPLKVQALEYRVEHLENSALNRRVLIVTIVGWVLALAGLIAGVAFK